MEYLHLISNENEKELVRRIAQNDPTMTMTAFGAEEHSDVTHLFLALGHALMGNTFLYKLQLVNPMLTEEAAHALAQGMVQSKIKILALDGSVQEVQQEQQQQGAPQDDDNNDDDESAALQLQERRRRIICDIFYRGIQSSHTIQHLCLCQILLLTDEVPGDAWKDALLGVTSITVFALDGLAYILAFSEVLAMATLLKELTVVLEGVEPNDMAILAQGLCHNTSLTSLDLVNDHLNSQVNMQILFSQELNSKSSITMLMANQCRIDDECIKLLADHWLPHCPIQQLSLSENDIGPAGAQYLVQALAAAAAHHPASMLLKLDLGNNKDIGYEGLRLIGNELENLHHLTHLSLNDCAIWNYRAKPKSKEAREQTRARQHAEQALLDGIKGNVSISNLVVSYNSLSRNVEDEIHFYAALNKIGRHLLSTLQGHDALAPFVWCHVFTKCQRQPYFGTSLMYFYLQELPTLVQRC